MQDTKAAPGSTQGLTLRMSHEEERARQTAEGLTERRGGFKHEFVNQMCCIISHCAAPMLWTGTPLLVATRASGVCSRPCKERLTPVNSAHEQHHVQKGLLLRLRATATYACLPGTRCWTAAPLCHSSWM